MLHTNYIWGMKCLIHMWYESYMRYGTKTYVTCLIYMWHASFICDMPHSYVTCLIHMWHASFICDMPHSYVTCLIRMWRDRFICDMPHSNRTWLILLKCYTTPCTLPEHKSLRVCNNHKIYIWIPQEAPMTRSTKNATFPKSTKSKLKFLAVLRHKFRLRFWCNLDVYRGIGVSGFGGFRGCSIFSGNSHSVQSQIASLYEYVTIKTDLYTHEQMYTSVYIESPRIAIPNHKSVWLYDNKHVYVYPHTRKCIQVCI